MLELGPAKGKIVSHRSRMIGDKIAIVIKCEVGNEYAEPAIWITEKSMGMARRALKVCGFDVDRHDMAELDIVSTMLVGNEVPLVVEMYNGKRVVKIDIDSRAEKAALTALTKQLRDVKKAAADDEPELPAPAPSTGSRPVEDYGELPF